MASGPALRRLKKEYTTLEKEPAPGAIARPLETNFLHAHFLLSGQIFHDTPYEGGVYHGLLKFPSNYPMKPPTVIMRTPSGRFEPDKKICFSLSDFHPELWNPMWSIRTILTGLVSFMNSDEMTTGGMSASASARVGLAKKSLKFCSEQDALAKELFGNELDSIMKERASFDSSWPPQRPAIIPKANSVEPIPKARAKLTVAKKSTETKVEQEAPSGKNAAKNKKKKEREKRKKVAKKFLANISKQVPDFVGAIQVKLKDENNIDVSEYYADHVCWRTDSIEEYAGLVSALRSNTDDFVLLIESEIGGRSIATFRLVHGISVGDRIVDVVEIPAPKKGSPYKTGLEHMEFVIGGNKFPSSPMSNDSHLFSLDEFVRQHPQIEFNTKARSKTINPDVSMKVELDDFGLCSIKFHLVPLVKVIEYEKDSIHVQG